ncbi:MAG: ABC transporter ATP-binding protein [Clostridiales bacterium]|nr:ABC transporter ATP-binding protein [Clostridiales bacterium]
MTMELRSAYNGQTSLTATIADVDRFVQEMEPLLQAQTDSGVLEYYHFRPEKEPSAYDLVLPLVLAGRPYEEMERKLKPLAEQLGIADILIKYPYEVSGGQKQRAAVARALITDPQIVLADEPTGALDSRSSDNLLELFGEINKGGQTILMVTHSVKAASHAGRVLFLRDGRVYHQLYRGSESREAQFRRISDTLTVLTQGGENHG